MERNKILFAAIVVLAATAVTFTSWGGGASEGAASSSGRGKYLAGQGIIIPPDEVIVDSYIASIDYRYPEPEQDLGVTLYSGHRQISSGGFWRSASMKQT